MRQDSSRSRLADVSFGDAFRYAATSFGAVILVLPMLAVIVSSFGETAYARFPPQGFTLHWYTAFDEVPGLIASLIYSLKLSLIVTAMSVALALLSAIGLTLRVIPGRALITSFLMLPLVLPSIVVGLALMLFFSAFWTADYFTGLVIGHLIISFPYALRSILPALETFDRNLWAASRTLGANPWQAFRTILAPIAMPSVLSAALFAFLISFDNYNVSAFLQDPLTPPLPVVLYNQAEQALSPVLMAVSSALILFSVVLVALFGKYLISTGK
ncbi:ABC transporter permease [Bosea sp. ASV33]|uniref:ABC transporter permease n=1 Tax=Bosea sp. ASV33 TaxID=2795106 RepID=UPI0018EAB705|nr:ABC transporter permease [Bosea sp. ASV33]